MKLTVLVSLVLAVSSLAGCSFETEQEKQKKYLWRLETSIENRVQEEFWKNESLKHHELTVNKVVLIKVGENTYEGQAIGLLRGGKRAILPIRVIADDKGYGRWVATGDFVDSEYSGLEPKFQERSK
jgi:hypothetical protein